MKFARLGPVLLVCSSLLGCIGVIPMRQRTVGPQGVVDKVDLTFLVPRKTSHAEVLEKLRSIDTNVPSSRFFVGRWRTSKLGAWAAAGGYGGAAATGGRLWRNANILLKFDSSDRVESYEVFPDKFAMMRLEPVSRDVQVLPGETDQVVVPCGSGCEVSAHLLLSRESLEVEETTAARGRKQLHYAIPLKAWKGVHLDRYQDQAGYVAIDLLFAEDLRRWNGPRGTHVHLEVTIRQLVNLLAFRRAYGEPTPVK